LVWKYVEPSVNAISKEPRIEVRLPYVEMDGPRGAGFDAKPANTLEYISNK
jgi:hypothetical protein